MIVISSVNHYENKGYLVFNHETEIATGVDWNTAIKLVSDLAPIVWTTKHTQETLDYCNDPDPILRKGKLYALQMYSDSFNQYVASFNQETGLINDGYRTESYVTKEGYDYFFNYEDALANYKQQIENKLGALYTELNYWNKIKLSLR